MSPNCKKLRNLLFNLAENDETAGDVANTVAWSFDYLHEDVKNNLLLELRKKEESAEIVKKL